MDRHRGWRPDGDQRRRRHPRTPHPGAARRADHPPAARRYRGQAGGDRRRRPAQPGRALQRPAARHARRRSGSRRTAHAAAGRGHRLAGHRLTRPGRRAAYRRCGADASRAGRADERRLLPVGARVLGALRALREASGDAARQRGRAASRPDGARHGDRLLGRRFDSNRPCCNRFPTVCMSGWRCCSTCWWVRSRGRSAHERV